MSEVSIRRAVASDSRALYDLAMEPSVRASSTRSEHFTWGEHQVWWQRRFYDPRTLIWVATVWDCHCLVGQIRYGLDGDEAEIAVSVFPGWRRQGIARMLLENTRLDAVARLGAARLKALVVQGNEASEALFHTCGFNTVAVEERMGKQHSVWVWP